MIPVYRRRLGIDGDGGRAVALEAAREQRGGVGLAKAGRIDKNPLRVRCEVAAAGELGHRKAAAGEQAQRAFRATEKESVAIAHAHEAGEAMLALQSGGGEEDLEFPGAFAGRIAR